MARTVEDLALLYPIIAGPDGRDTQVQPVPVDDVPKLALKKLRVAFAPTFPGFPLAADIRHAIEELVQQLNRCSVVVEEAALPKLAFNEESRAGELDGMAVGAFQPQENKPPITLAQCFEALHRRDQSIIGLGAILRRVGYSPVPTVDDGGVSTLRKSRDRQRSARGPFAASPFRLAAFLCRRRDY